MGNPINTLTNDISGVVNDIGGDIVKATNAIEDGTLSALDAMDNGLKYTSENLDDDFQMMIDEGFATSLDVFSYIANLAAYNGTGNYYGTSKNDVIIAVDILGFIPHFRLLREIWGSGEGKIYAKDGDDTIIMASFAATVYTGSGNDTIYGGSAALRVEDTTGNLNIGLASISTIVNKSGDGNITFGGQSGYLNIDHKGQNGDITAYSIAAANHIDLSGTSGDITFYGLGIGNIINHSVSDYGKVEFYGSGSANVITASGNHTDIDFYGAGAANVIVNTASKGDMNIYALGQRNLVVKVGDGNFNAYLASFANVAVHKGDGDSKISMLGGLNTYTKVGDGDTILAMAGGLNVATMVGDGDVYGGLAGIGNVVTKKGNGDMYMGLAAAGNVVSHIDNSGNNSDTIIAALGGANVVTKKGNGEFSLGMAGLGNVATHIGDGNVNSAQVGGASILTKIGDGDVNAVQIGGANILTQKGDGHSLALMGGNANVFTKIGNGLTATTMLSNGGIGGNLFTHIGNGDSYAFMSGTGNIFTKVGGTNTDKTMAAMFGAANLFTHIGDGMSVALMHSAGNIFTKVGDGPVIAAMFGSVGNIATHIGDGDDYALMVGGSANIFTKVGDGQVVALMSGSANIATHIGDGAQITLAQGSANIISKLGQGDQISIAVGTANMITHIDLDGESNSYNFAKGDLNMITKIGDGVQASAVLGKFNLVTHVGDGDTYLFSHGGEANMMTKVGDGNLTVGIMESKINLVTQVGEGDGYYGIWGEANIVTKVGDGRAVVAMKGMSNILTNVGDGQQLALMTGDLNVNVKVGDGDSINIINGKNNIVTKVGDGMHLAAMKGELNANIQIGDGMTISAMHAKNNLTVKIGNGDFYGLSIAKSDGSFKDMLNDLFSQIKETVKGHIVGEIIGQLVWGPEGQVDAASDAPALTNDETTDPNVDDNVTPTTTETSESSLDTQVDSVNNAAIDTSASAEDISNAGLADSSDFGAQYSTLAVGEDMTTDGSISQRKLELEEGELMQGHLTNVIVGDFNGDGLDDIIRQEKGDYDNDDVRTADVYLASSHGVFVRHDLTDFTLMGGDNNNIMVGDFNGDGLDDFIKQEKAWYDDDNVDVNRVYLSNGDGTFSQQDLPDASLMKGDFVKLVIGDFNGDGNDDFIRQEKTTGTTANKLYLSDGVNSFVGHTLTDYGAMRGDSVDLIVGDFNGDGNDDFIRQEKGAYDNDDTKTAEIFLSNGNNAFTKQLLTDHITMKGDETNLIVGDFNGDGMDDFIRQEKGIADDDSIDTAHVYLANGDGTFTKQDLTDHGSMKGDQTNLIIGDYNGDGKDDFIRQEKNGYDNDSVNTASMYLSDGDGTFTRNDVIDDVYMKGDETNLIIGDYDGDGTDDIIRQEKVEIADGNGTVSLYTNKKVYDNIETPSDPNFDGSIKQVKLAIANSDQLKGDQTKIITGDFNGDGKDDFIRQEYNQWDDDAGNTANLYMSNGDGTFSQQLLTDQEIMKGDQTNIIIGDYNGDGKDDFIRQERNDWDDDNGGTAQVYLSEGDGTFSNQLLTNYDTMKGDLTNIIIGDYNGDGKDDFIRQEKGAWDNDWDGTANLYLSNGNGTFSNQLLTDHASMKGDYANIIVGDFNGDDKDDFIRQEKNNWVDNSIPTAQLYLSNGTGAFSVSVLTDSAIMKGDHVNILVGDFNDDGRDDFIRQEKGVADDDSIDSNRVYLSNSDGTFSSQDLTDHTTMKGDQTNLIIGDYNGDGKDDFIRQEKNDWDNDEGNTAHIYLSDGDGTFTKHDVMDDEVIKGDLTNLIIGDYDGDGKDDFIRQEKGDADNDEYNTANLYLNRNDYADEAIVAPVSTTSEDLVISDDIYNSGNTSVSDAGNSEVNSSVSQSDADADALAQEGDDNAAQAQQSQADIASDNDILSDYLTGLADSYSMDDNIARLPEEYSLGTDEAKIIKGDFNGDGLDDFIRQDASADASRAYYSNGDGTFLESDLLDSAIMHQNATNLIVADIDGNGRDDLIWQGANASSVYFSSNADHNSFAWAGFVGETALGTNTSNIIVGDFNNDGKSDFITQDKASGESYVYYFYNDNPGVLNYVKQALTDNNLTFGANDATIIVGDFDGDGDDDFLKQNVSNGGLRRFNSTGDGSGTFTWGSLSDGTAIVYDAGEIIVGDFNGDGKDDFISQSHDTGENALYLSVDGLTFDKSNLPDNLSMNGEDVQILVGDYNNDGVDDFIRQEKSELNDGLHTATKYISNGDGTFYQEEIAASSNLKGDASNIIIGDYDGDGQDDFIAQQNNAINNSAKLYLSSNVEEDEVILLPEEYALNGNDAAIFSGDYNGDGIDDFIRQDAGSAGTKIYYANGDGTYEEHDIHGASISGQNSAHLIFGDFNGDGISDYLRQSKATGSGVGAKIHSATNGVYAGIGGIVDASFTGSDSTFIVGDFDGDNRDDFIKQDEGSGASYVYYSRSGATNAYFNYDERELTDNHLTFGTDDATIIVGDFNGDGNDDFLKQNVSNGGLRRFNSTGDGSGTFTWGSLSDGTAIVYDTGKIIVGDFNGDGKDDFISQSHNTGENALYLSVDGLTFDKSNLLDNLSMNGEDVHILIGDFNGDGFDDFIRQEKTASNNGINTVTMYLSNGDSTFLTSKIEGNPDLQGDFSNIIVGDYDGDGKDDFMGQSNIDDVAHIYLSKDKYVLSNIVENGDALRDAFTIGVVDVDSYLQDAENSATTAVTDAQTNNDNAQSELSEADLNADQANSDATASQADATTAQSDADAQEAQSQSDATNAENQANSAETTADAQSGSNNVDDTDNSGREESNGSGLTVDNSTQSGVVFNFTTDEQAISDNEETLLNGEDEAALQGAIELIGNIGTDDNASSQSESSPVDTSGEGINNNGADNSTESTADDPYDVPFEDFGGGKKRSSDEAGNTNNDQVSAKHHVTRNNGEEFIRQMTEGATFRNVSNIKDTVEIRSHDAIENHRDDIFNSTVSLINEGLIKLNANNIQLVSDIKSQIPGEISGNSEAMFLLAHRSLLIKSVVSREILDELANSSTNAAELKTEVENFLNDKIKTKLEAIKTDVDLSTSQGLYPDLGGFKKLFNPEGSKFGNDNAFSPPSGKGTNLPKKLEDLGIDPAENRYSSQIDTYLGDHGGNRKNRKNEVSEDYKKAFEGEKFTFGLDEMKAKWTDFTNDKDISEHLKDGSYKGGMSHNHILADSSVEVLVVAAAMNIANISDAQEKAVAMINMKSFFAGITGAEVQEGVFVDRVGESAGGSVFANKAFTQFQAAVTKIADTSGDKKFTGVDGVKSLLNSSIVAASYAPGNLRWGHKGYNTERGNFFDPVFESVNGAIGLSAASLAVKQAVDSISNVVGESLANKTLKIDTIDGNIYSSSKVKIIDADNNVSYNDNPYTIDADMLAVDGSNNITNLTGDVKNLLANSSDNKYFNPSDNLKNALNNDNTITNVTFTNTDNGVGKNTNTQPEAGDNDHSNSDTVETESNGKNKLKIEHDADGNVVSVHTDREQTDSRYELVKDANGNLVQDSNFFIYEYTNADGSKSYILHHKEHDFSIYAGATKPLDPSGNITLSGLDMTIYAHGEIAKDANGNPTDYTTNNATSYMAEAGNKLSAKTTSVADSGAIAAETKAANSTVTDYVLSKMRSANLIKDDAFTDKNSGEMLNAMASSSSMDGKAIVRPGKHTNIKMSELSAILSSYGVGDMVGFFCRHDSALEDSEIERTQLEESNAFKDSEEKKDIVKNTMKEVKGKKKDDKSDVKEVSDNDNSKTNDLDGDGIKDNVDVDMDGDGVGNTVDSDMDGDGIDNADDSDMDGDGISNAEDSDIDGDGMHNAVDGDADGDGIHNSEDNDIDGDGVENSADSDADGNGVDDAIDNDSDGDGINDDVDPDIDGDGILNAADSDSDGDGVNDDVQSVISDSVEVRDKDERQASHTPTSGTGGGSSNSSNKESTRGNVQIQIGDGEFVSGMWGENNLGLKIGTGGFKGAVFGENNILVHIGNAGDVEYSTNVGGYEAFEGAQLMIGNKNVSFNYGDSNDFIVAIDKSIPLPPFMSPFDGPSNIVGYLQDTLVTLGQEENGSKDLDYYHKQNELWSYGNAELIVNNASGLDQNSDVYYQTIFDYGSESDRDTRALQTDLETRLNNDFNNWSSPGGEEEEDQTVADQIKNTQANIVIAGQGADIIMANGANQFLFGDNIQSVMDVTLSSLFGMLTHEDTGENTLFKKKGFEINVSILPDELEAQFLNMIAVSLPEVTLGDIFTIDYNANGSIYSSNGVSLNGDEMMHLLESIAQFGNNQISRYSDPEYIMDSLKASLNLAEGAAEQIKTTFGIQDPEGYDPNEAAAALPGQEEGDASSGEALGFGGLTMPSIFDIGGIASGFGNIPKLIEDLAGTINSFGGDANNIQDAIIEFFTTSGYMQDDGDLIVSMGEKNYSWGGHGSDIGAFLGTNNNFWGGRGEDLFYGLGDNNQFSGNQDNDTGILIGINNLFLGGQGDDFALASGRLSNLSGGSGDDSLFVFGADSWLSGDEGDDYIVAGGNFNTIMAGEGNDYVVSTGNYNSVDSGKGKDMVTVFGNKNTVYSDDGHDMLRIMGYQNDINAGSGDDLITLDVQSKNNTIEGSSGDDSFILGGYNNKIYGQSGSDQFIINNQSLIDNRIKGITSEDAILFEGIDYSNLWFERQDDDLIISVDRGFTQEEIANNASLLSEAIGTAYFEDYFTEGNAANIVASYIDKENYSILDAGVIDDMISIMSNYDIDLDDYEVGGYFFNQMLFADEFDILSLWQDTTSYVTGDDTDNILYSYQDYNVLTGKAGNDIFTFESIEDSFINSPDLITDFTKGEDKIDLSSLAFTGLVNDQLLEDDTLLSYIYDAANDQTVVTDKADTFQFKLSGNIALDISDFDFMNNEVGRNVIAGDASNNTISDESGNDEIYGQEGDDVIYGGLGKNILNGGLGADTLTGGLGNDDFFFDALLDSTSVSTDLITDFTQGEDKIDLSNLTFTGITNDQSQTDDTLLTYLYSSSTGQTIVSNQAATFEFKLSGNIVLNADDFDFMNYEAGRNVIVGTGGVDVIYGGAGNDNITSSYGADFLYGEGGDDHISGGSHNDTIMGGAGDDEIYGDNNDDYIDGGLGDDIIDGGYGSDDLHGGDGDDVITGGASGYDSLTGGLGSDTLTGGSFNDIFNFESLADSTINASDLITDFTQGADTINMSNLSFTGITNDQSQTDSDILTYEYDSVNNQTIVSNEEDTFAFKLSGNIALNVNDFDFIG